VIGRAVGDPTRAAMLLRLMDGCGHPARDLATAAGVSASAASAHLRHLTEAELITVTVVGRTRQRAIASPEVAAAIEALAAISPLLPVESLRQATSGSQLRTARACYSHLGGELAVAVADLADAGAITPLTPPQSASCITSTLRCSPLCASLTSSPAPGRACAAASTGPNGARIWPDGWALPSCEPCSITAG
jgi:DNA-binding transcriptional ArsR family regulator